MPGDSAKSEQARLYIPIGAELIRIGIETYSICFEFSDDTLEVGGEFMFTDRIHEIDHFRPGKQAGAVQKLWSLIGDKIAEFVWPKPVWEDTIHLRFTSGRAITIPPSPSGPRGTMFHHHRTPEGHRILENY